MLPPLAIQRVRPEVTELWKRPGVGGRNLVLGYNCFATAREAAAQKDYVIPMSQVRAEAARWGSTTCAARRPVRSTTTRRALSTPSSNSSRRTAAGVGASAACEASRRGRGCRRQFRAGAGV